MAATGCASRRTRSCSSSTWTQDQVESLVARCGRSGSTRPVELAPRDHGLHRDRVLQARDRRDQRPAPRRSWTSSRAGSRDIDADITININGCPNACARTQVADIGLKGQLVPGPDGVMVEGFQIHLGGALSMAAGQQAGFGRKLRGLKTTADELPAYVERVTREFVADRTPGETFAEWVLRAEEARLK